MVHVVMPFLSSVRTGRCAASANLLEGRALVACLAQFGCFMVSCLRRRPIRARPSFFNARIVSPATNVARVEVARILGHGSLGVVRRSLTGRLVLPAFILHDVRLALSHDLLLYGENDGTGGGFRERCGNCF
jgi:hypothetical protein